MEHVTVRGQSYRILLLMELALFQWKALSISTKGTETSHIRAHQQKWLATACMFCWNNQQRGWAQSVSSRGTPGGQKGWEQKDSSREKGG